jgi:signal transduction histidine kinase/ActR/RegA family two-component response regulator
MKRRSPPQLPKPDFRALFESAPGLYLILTSDLTIVAVSEAYLRATMTRREEILGRPLFEVFPDNPDDPTATGVANLRSSLERVLTHGAPDAMAVQKYDIRRPASEGGGFDERYWSPVNTPVFGRNGQIRYIIHAVEDVTDFMRLKLQGSQEQKLHQELMTRAGMMEAEIYRRAQQIQEANRQLRELQTELEQRVQARTADLQRANEELQRQIAERKRTEEALVRSEEQLRQAQKLEAVGRLAGGVAHDFNNLLTVILSYSHLLLEEAAPGEATRSELQEIQRAGNRAAELTRQLLAFSRQQVLEPRVLDLNRIISGLDKMLRRLIGEDIDLVTHPSSGLGMVQADPGQIEQVIMNLAVNARDAMPGGGKLTIETGNVELGEEYTALRGDLRPGHYAMLAVSDTGCGMSAEVKARIFEPFYTTKEKGKGTGLGLSTVHGIVKQSEGHIEVYSEPGHGTTFKIYLPRVEAAEEMTAVAGVTTARLEGTETVLVVEDEMSIRRLIGRSLRARGYRVLEANDGSEAIAHCERRSPRVDLLITDVVMPMMSGPELVLRVTAGCPGLKVLFISGYTDRALIHQGLRHDGSAFLQKPFTPETLARKVRELLGEAEAQAA